MVFAIYRQRRHPWAVIYDFELGDPPKGQPQDYDCVGVYRLLSEATRYMRKGAGCIGVSGHWSMKSAAEVLAGDHRAVRTRKDVFIPLTRLWHLRGGGVPAAVIGDRGDTALSIPKVVQYGRPGWE